MRSFRCLPHLSLGLLAALSLNAVAVDMTGHCLVTDNALYKRAELTVEAGEPGRAPNLTLYAVSVAEIRNAIVSFELDPKNVKANDEKQLQVRERTSKLNIDRHEGSGRYERAEWTSGCPGTEDDCAIKVPVYEKIFLDLASCQISGELPQ